MVGGTTGEYSDRTEWVVDAWRSEAEAQARVAELTEAMQRFGITGREPDRYGDSHAARRKEMRKLDPAFDDDYTGTSYYINELELKP
jgi:hypothetical protein